VHAPGPESNGTAVSSAAILFDQIVKAATGFVPAFS
jgi:hypothetical protein